MAAELSPVSCESASGNKQSPRLWDWLNICKDAFYRLSIDLGVFKPNPGFKIAQECKARLRGNSSPMWADGTITHFWEESFQKLNTEPQPHIKENLAATIKCFGYRVNGASMRCWAYQTQIIHRRDRRHMLQVWLPNVKQPLHQTSKDYYYFYYCLLPIVTQYLVLPPWKIIY